MTVKSIPSELKHLPGEVRALADTRPPSVQAIWQSLRALRQVSQSPYLHNTPSARFFLGKAAEQLTQALQTSGKRFNNAQALQRSLKDAATATEQALDAFAGQAALPPVEAAESDNEEYNRLLAWVDEATDIIHQQVLSRHAPAPAILERYALVARDELSKIDAGFHQPADTFYEALNLAQTLVSQGNNPQQGVLLKQIHDLLKKAANEMAVVVGRPKPFPFAIRSWAGVKDADPQHVLEYVLFALKEHFPRSGHDGAQVLNNAAGLLSSLADDVLVGAPQRGLVRQASMLIDQAVANYEAYDLARQTYGDTLENNKTILEQYDKLIGKRRALTPAEEEKARQLRPAVNVIQQRLESQRLMIRPAWNAILPKVAAVIEKVEAAIDAKPKGGIPPELADAVRDLQGKVLKLRLGSIPRWIKQLEALKQQPGLPVDVRDTNQPKWFRQYTQILNQIGDEAIGLYNSVNNPELIRMIGLAVSDPEYHPKQIADWLQSVYGRLQVGIGHSGTVTSRPASVFIDTSIDHLKLLDQRCQGLVEALSRLARGRSKALSEDTAKIPSYYFSGFRSFPTLDPAQSGWPFNVQPVSVEMANGPTPNNANGCISANRRPAQFGPGWELWIIFDFEPKRIWIVGRIGPPFNSRNQAFEWAKRYYPAAQLGMWDTFGQYVARLNQEIKGVPSVPPLMPTTLITGKAIPDLPLKLQAFLSLIKKREQQLKPGSMDIWDFSETFIRPLKKYFYQYLSKDIKFLLNHRGEKLQQNARVLSDYFTFNPGNQSEIEPWLNEVTGAIGNLIQLLNVENQQQIRFMDQMQSISDQALTGLLAAYRRPNKWLKINDNNRSFVGELADKGWVEQRENTFTLTPAGTRIAQQLVDIDPFARGFIGFRNYAGRKDVPQNWPPTVIDRLRRLAAIVEHRGKMFNPEMDRLAWQSTDVAGFRKYYREHIEKALKPIIQKGYGELQDMAVQVQNNLAMPKQEKGWYTALADFMSRLADLLEKTPDPLVFSSQQGKPKPKRKPSTPEDRYHRDVLARLKRFVVVLKALDKNFKEDWNRLSHEEFVKHYTRPLFNAWQTELKPYLTNANPALDMLVIDLQNAIVVVPNIHWAKEYIPTILTRAEKLLDKLKLVMGK